LQIDYLPGRRLTALAYAVRPPGSALAPVGGRRSRPRHARRATLGSLCRGRWNREGAWGDGRETRAAGAAQNGTRISPPV